MLALHEEIVSSLLLMEPFADLLRFGSNSKVLMAEELSFDKFKVPDLKHAYLMCLWDLALRDMQVVW